MMPLMRPAFHSLIALTVVAGSGQTAAPESRSVLAERVTALTRNAVWKLVASIPVRFRTFHPQGMVRDRRDVLRVVRGGQGSRGWAEGSAICTRSTAAGNLVADLTLGEGNIYHPGGIDYDGDEHLGPGG